MRRKPNSGLDPKTSIIEQRKTIGEAIVKISDAVVELKRDTGLNLDAIVVLIAHQSKLPQKTIRMVLTSLASLKTEFTQ